VPHQADLDIVRALRRGDRRMFDAFFDESFPRLYRFVLLHVDGNVDVAREIVRCALIRCVEAIDQYRGRTTLQEWINDIAQEAIAARHGGQAFPAPRPLLARARDGLLDALTSIAGKEAASLD
jgi:DNA-directed RNA polymerase specialized sigma24 family protein